jgi:hypothetical protein
MNETIAGEFLRLDGLRQERLAASERFAYYTIPSVFPQVGQTDQSTGVGMLDSIGAAVANHFANKLVTTLFSPNRPFFRLRPDSRSPQVRELEDARDGGDLEVQKQAQASFDNLRAKFVRVEKGSVQYLERIGYRTSATAAAKLLIITGDVVIRTQRDQKAVAYSMRDYVCEKDISGRDVVLIVRDTLVYGALTPKQQEQVRANTKDGATFDPTTSVTIYTRLGLTLDGRYVITQAINDVDVEEEEPRIVTEMESPFTHLSWNLTKGENYGRGLVEDFSGSFHMIDSFTNFQARMAAKMADIKIMVDPASGIDVDHLNSSETGTYIAGKPGAVQNLATGLDQSLQYLEAILQVHKRQISAAFLYQSGQTRDAERVTAEEIRENAAELEIAHGGVYSRFASEWQAKVARESVAAQGEDMGDIVEPQIMTGMDSLSRVGEMQMIRIWLQDLALLATVPEDVRAWIKSGEFASYSALQRGVDHGVFVMTVPEMEEKIAKQMEAEKQRMDDEAAAKSQEQAGAAAAQAV